MLGDNDAVLGFFLRLLGIQMERNCRTQKRECSPRAEQKQEARPGLLGGQETKTSPPNVVKSQDKSGFRSFRLEGKIFESFLPQLLF